MLGLLPYIWYQAQSGWTFPGGAAYGATLLLLPGTMREVVLGDLLPATRRVLLRG